MKRFFTSEAVCVGHPDKVCDQIADGILDAILEKDPKSRVAVEVAVKSGLVFVIGEVTTNANVEVESVVRETVKEIGYVDPDVGFDHRSCGVLTVLTRQSPDIALGVDPGGAGDQGIMYGYACDETENFMPLPIELSRRLVNALREARETKALPYLRPDGKAQVTVQYENDVAKRVEAVVVSTQHGESVSLEQLRKDVKEKIVRKVVPSKLIDSKTNFHINPTGRFVEGGPKADSGMTGRKLIVDTYGGVARHGGGSFSGKDPTKVDRSATYAARHAAKNVVAAGLAKRCEVQLCYAIGVSKPLAVSVDTFGSGKIPDDKIAHAVQKVFDFRPAAIVEYYKLRRPIYKQTARFGHFGVDKPDYTWEQLEMVERLRKIAKLGGENSKVSRPTRAGKRT